MPKNYQNIHSLKVSEELLSFVNNELLKDLDITSENFWLGFDNVVHELAPKNKELLEIRDPNALSAAIELLENKIGIIINIKILENLTVIFFLS